MTIPTDAQIDRFLDAFHEMERAEVELRLIAGRDPFEGDQAVDVVLQYLEGMLRRGRALDTVAASTADAPHPMAGS